MKTPLVTVALSTYNVAPFVLDSLKCIEEQTYKKIEILCIDDASTDGTYDKISERAKRDSRYRIIRQSENKGLSVSRNIAIAEATGEYIVMLDGDDLFDRNMINTAVDVALAREADMVIWDYVPFQNIEELGPLTRCSSRLNELDASDKIGLLQRPAFMWVKMLSVKKLRESQISFPPRLTKQDIPVHWKLVTTWDKIAIIPKKFSFYRLRPNATSMRKDRSIFSLAKVMDIVGDDLRKDGLYETYRNEYLRSRLTLLHGMYDFVKPEFKNEAMRMILERIDGEALEYLSSYANLLSKRTRLFYDALDGNIFAKILYSTLIACRLIYRKFKSLI